MATDLPLTPEDVAEIVSILDGGGYDKLDIATARFRLRVRREGDGWTQEWDYSGGEASPAAAIDAAAVAVEEDGEGLAVRAALPGTFYRAPQPGAPAFVDIGDEVVPDTVVGIIETMKLMNPVHAGVTGRVTAILVGNSQAVDAQAVLMRVEA
ncbi:acetyl-CoA carboxylase biotin carboxyl carrier protein [Sphingomonas sp. MMS24-J13]|uniref:acetyl-CoA carboxylase biotin carboxyl carrier protein n=1 Tax=Sphingomonas sp. MMS24-J13 TaxID=3238686 RepID=UPI00384FF02A